MKEDNACDDKSKEVYKDIKRLGVDNDNNNKVDTTNKKLNTPEPQSAPKQAEI